MKHIICTLLLLLTIVGSASAGGSEYDGTTSAIQVTSQAAISTLALTIGCWTRFEGLGESSLGRILEKDTAWLLRMNSGSTYRFDAPGWTTTDGSWQWASQATNTWAHVAVSYDGSADTNEAIGYLNGTAQSTTNSVMPVGTYVAGTGDLVIGNNVSGTRTFDGQLAECFYYNRILAPNEVSQVYRAGPVSLPRGLIGYWPLGVFGPRNYTSTTGLTGTPTSITVSTVAGPPIAYASQGEEP